MTDEYDERQGTKGGLDAGALDALAGSDNTEGERDGGVDTPAGGVTGSMGRSQEDIESPHSLSNAAQRQVEDSQAG